MNFQSRMQINTISFRRGVQVRLGWAWLIVLPLLGLRVAGGDAAAQFRKEIQPILTEYCSDCHADGAKKGNVAFDELKSDDALLNHDLWLKVLKNTRAGLMPPEKKPKPSAEERAKLEQWIKYSAFAIDPKNPDPAA